MKTKQLFSKTLCAALFAGALFLGSSAVFAQVKIGDNPTTINAGSALEIESTNKGLLMPRIALTNTTIWGLAGTAVAGMHVYNTAFGITSTNTSYPTLVAKIGEYYWDGTGWVALETVSKRTIITSYSQSAGMYMLLPPNAAYCNPSPTIPNCAPSANLNGTLNITNATNDVVIDVVGQYAAMLNGSTDVKVVVYIDKTTAGVYEPAGIFTDVIGEPSANLNCYASSFNYKLALKNLPVRSYNVKVYLVPWAYLGSLTGVFGLGVAPANGCGTSTATQFLITSVTQ